MSKKECDPMYDTGDQHGASDAAFNAWLDEAVSDMFARLAAAPLPEALLNRLAASEPSHHDARQAGQ